MTGRILLAAALVASAVSPGAAGTRRMWTVGVYPAHAGRCTGLGPSAIPDHEMDLASGEQIDWRRPVGSDPSDRTGIVVRLMPERLGGEDVVVGDIRAIGPGPRKGTLGVPPLISPILSDAAIHSVCMRDPATRGRWIQIQFRPR